MISRRTALKLAGAGAAAAALPVTGYAAAEHRQTTISKPVLVCIGDSITACWALQWPGTDAWPERLGATLFDWTVVNAGIGGNTVIAPPPAGQQTMTDRFQTDVLSVPGVAAVIISGGINDCGIVTSTQLCLALQSLVNRAVAAGLQTHVCTITPMLSSFNNYAGIEPDREGTNAWLRAYYGGPPGLFDFDGVLRIPSTELLDPQYATGITDGYGVHPNGWGNVRLADYCRQFIS